MKFVLKMERIRNQNHQNRFVDAVIVIVIVVPGVKPRIVTWASRGAFQGAENSGSTATATPPTAFLGLARYFRRVRIVLSYCYTVRGSLRHCSLLNTERRRTMVGV